MFYYVSVSPLAWIGNVLSDVGALQVLAKQH